MGIASSTTNASRVRGVLVDDSQIADGLSLVYDEATNRLVYRQVESVVDLSSYYTKVEITDLLDNYAGTDHIHSLDNLFDVTIDTPLTTQTLVYNGSSWVNRVINVSDVDGLSSQITSLSNEIDTKANQSDLTVTIDTLDAHRHSTSNPHEVTASQVGAYTTGQVDSLLSGLSLSLDDLSDVSVSAPVGGQVVRHNGSGWSNSVLSISDTSGLSTALDSKLDLSGGTLTGDVTSSGMITADSFSGFWSATPAPPTASPAPPTPATPGRRRPGARPTRTRSPATPGTPGPPGRPPPAGPRPPAASPGAPATAATPWPAPRWSPSPPPAP